MSKDYKINCGIKKLKLDERRGSMKECLKRSQVRYFGLFKIDPLLIEEKLKEKKISEANRFKYSIGRMYGLKARGEKIKKVIEVCKIKKDKEKEEFYTKELEAIRKELKECLPIAIEREKENKLKREQERKEKEFLDRLYEKKLKLDKKKKQLEKKDKEREIKKVIKK